MRGTYTSGQGALGYEAVTLRNGLCVDVEGGSAANGAKVIQWPAGEGTNQQWRLVAL
ncbi:RICIN domain-containing protein [Streptomyces sp. NPDC001123]